MTPIPPPPPPSPAPLGASGPPQKVIQQQGTRTWGWLAWAAWIDVPGNPTVPCTRYAWTRGGAERLAQRMLEEQIRRTPRPPEHLP